MDYTEVLRLINVAREACGKDILAAIRDGAPMAPDSCPIANSLDEGTVQVENHFAAFETDVEAEAVRKAWCTDVAQGGSAGVYVNGRDVDPSRTAVLPDLLAEFVHRYDAGRVPWEVAHNPAHEGKSEYDPTHPDYDADGEAVGERG